MAQLILTDVEDAVLANLRERANLHGRTPSDEAKNILAEVLRTNGAGAWQSVDAIFHRLATANRTFSDSADLLREDRGR
jgi:plasmid stability protein